MHSEYPSCLRQRQSAQQLKTEDIAEFTSSQNCLDERTILKLFRKPSPTNCLYRANELICFLFRHVLKIGPRLLLFFLFLIAVALIGVIASGMADELLTAGNRPTDQKVLQFNFVVICICYSLIFYAIAADYSKIVRISRAAIESCRQHTNQHKEGSKTQSGTTNETFSAQRSLGRLSAMPVPARQRDFVENVPEKKTSASEDMKELFSNSAIPSLQSTLISENLRYTTNWWSTFSILRLILHCFLYQIRSMYAVLLRPILKLQTGKKLKRAHRFSDGLQPLRDSFVKIIISILLIIVAIVTLGNLKVRYQQDRPYTGNQILINQTLINHTLWTSAVTGFLCLHFFVLLSFAALFSSSTANISVVGLFGRWLLVLIFCLILQNAVLPHMFLEKENVVNKIVYNDFFTVYTDIERFLDIPFVNSIGASKEKVSFLLNSLITAIIAAFLYQTGIMQIGIASVGSIFESLLKVSPIEGIVILITICATQCNVLILIMPFLAKMSEAELFCTFVLMLVRMPSESNIFWSHVDEKQYNSTQLDMTDEALTTPKNSTYMPERFTVRSLLMLPLTMLFCRILYPARGKLFNRSAQFRRLVSLKSSKPFKSLSECLLFFVVYCLRSLCRYFVLIIVFYCFDYFLKFFSTVFNFKIGSYIASDWNIYTISATVISIFTDQTELYASKGHPLSMYITEYFFFPKATFETMFYKDEHLNIAREADPILDFYHEVSFPVKQIVASGSFNWDTIAMFLAFTSDFLIKDRRTKVGFIIRGCVAAVLVYAAMQNLIHLVIEPEILRKIFQISKAEYSKLLNPKIMLNL